VKRPSFQWLGWYLSIALLSGFVVKPMVDAKYRREESERQAAAMVSGVNAALANSAEAARQTTRLEPFPAKLREIDKRPRVAQRETSTPPKATGVTPTDTGRAIAAQIPPPSPSIEPRRSTIARPSSSPLLYTATGSGHWIEEVSSSGRFIKLEDGSLWEISDLDQVDTNLWLAVSNIIVLENDHPLYPYKLVNTSDGETAEAKLISEG